METIIIALLLTTLAGLSTGIGSFGALFVKKESKRFLSLGLGFSAGVMIAVSFIELLNGAIDAIGFVGGNIAFFIGISAMFVLDKVIPHEYIAEKLINTETGEAIGEIHFHSHSQPDSQPDQKIETQSNNSKQKALIKVGILTMFGIALHNFPEGLVTFAGTLSSLEIGVILAIAIAAHNIPEGLSVALPIYAATGNRWQAFKLSFISGVFEPLGALVAAVVLLPFLNDFLTGFLLAFVGGIMVYISFDELIPASREYSGGSELATLGVVVGMFFMVITLVLLNP
ncbi:MAG: zinc transporter ZupT [Candidatus Hermodarchaeota archaeon]